MISVRDLSFFRSWSGFVYLLSDRLGKIGIPEPRIGNEQKEPTKIVLFSCHNAYLLKFQAWHPRPNCPVRLSGGPTGPLTSADSDVILILYRKYYELIKKVVSVNYSRLNGQFILEQKTRQVFILFDSILILILYKKSFLF